MTDNAIIVMGLKRAKGILDSAEGDIDFAQFLIDKDIELLEREDSEAAQEAAQ